MGRNYLVTLCSFVLDPGNIRLSRIFGDFLNPLFGEVLEKARYSLGIQCGRMLRFARGDHVLLEVI
jgi:hypothetical protein